MVFNALTGAYHTIEMNEGACKLVITRQFIKSVML
jgi:hypothetical protein